jgi:phosphatidate cytidylyltransferase
MMVLVPLLLLGGQGTFLALVLALVALSLYEYLVLVIPERDWRGRWPVVMMGLILPLSAQTGESYLVLGLAIVTILTFILHLFGRGELQVVMARIGKSSFGLLYVGFLLSHLVLLRNLASGLAWSLLLLVVIFAGDTGAYYVGKAFGKHSRFCRKPCGRLGLLVSLYQALFPCPLRRIGLGTGRFGAGWRSV